MGIVSGVRMGGSAVLLELWWANGSACTVPIVSFLASQINSHLFYLLIAFML